MGVNAIQFIERAARMARKGQTEMESRIFNDRVALLLPNAAYQFSWEVAQDPRRRGRMRSPYTDVPLTSGQLELISGNVPNLLVPALQWALFFDGEDDDMQYPLVFKREPQSLFQPLNSNFGYVSVMDNFLITKRRTSGSLTEMSAVTLIANYVFDFNGQYPLPDEFEPDAIMTLANLAAADAETPA